MPLKLKEANFSTKAKLDRLTIPNWQKAYQLAIYKDYRGVELEFNEK